MDKLFPSPKGLSTPSPKPARGVITNADVYVSPSGRDGASGSESDPVATLEAARDILRRVRLGGAKGVLTAAVTAGEYRLSSLTFSAEDCDTAWRASGGEVILNGGAAINPADFGRLSEDELARLHGDAKDKVVKADLTKYGLTPDDWGKIYAVGSSNNASRYDGDTVGLNCEVFCDSRRMTLARFPNAPGYSKLDGVLDQGDVREFPPQNYFYDWDSRRNHRGGTYIMDRETNERVKGWRTLEDVWLFGYFYWDWADSSTPVASADTSVRTLSPKFVSSYAAREGANYYFFNVFEELDESGEWYLDRTNGILYVWPYGDTPNIEISITREPVIKAENVKNLTLDGFTVKGTRADGISITGEHCTVENCVVKNVLGNGITINGIQNTVKDCEITRTGRGGVIMTGGDRATLTPSNNRAENNLVHDWAEVYLTYQPAFGLHGVGAVCAHNEIFNSPHTAILYGGNDHLIEYNYIHDVCLLSTDAGAIYSGMDWAAHGTVIRYNCVCNIGGGKFSPDGIYWDDALSGQNAYGNLLINIPKYAVLIGGGRDNRLQHNIIINGGEACIKYDDRARRGAIADGWARESYDKLTGVAWRVLKKVPFRSEIWAKRFPSLATLREDFDDVNDPAFPPNPAGAYVADNIVVDKNGLLGSFGQSVPVYGEVRDNAVYSFDNDPGFVNAAEGDYRLREDSDALRKIPAFPQIPLSKIGRE